MKSSSKKKTSPRSSARRPAPGDSQAIDQLCELLAIPGGSGDELRVAQHLKDRLVQAGASPGSFAFDEAHRRSVHGGACGNLILKLPGTHRGPRRLLAAHMDTVPLCVGGRPKRVGSRIVPAEKGLGLGGDDRAGCAVLLATAAAAVRREFSHPPLTFLWTVQEEAGLHGARHVTLAKLGKPQIACNWDGGPAHRITLGATGGYRMEIETLGIPAHAGNHPERGVSAIAIAAIAITDLVENGWHGLIECDGVRGTSNVGVVRGGEATNVVTDRVELMAEARSHDPKLRKRIVKEIKEAFDRAAKRTRNADGKCGKVRFTGRLDYESFSLDRRHPSVVAAVDAIAGNGREPEFNISNGGLDANWLSARGVPTATLGCGQNAIHTAAEWLDLEEFAFALGVARRFASGGVG
ncbi:MAG: M20/M25/M40 family metallo-hydrolase [Planctomycetales bacterium]|nr:M20/M25/M40 family metallo-hydrolase [Planctomycetales bacterium]